jgi:hypothetical protein
MKKILAFCIMISIMFLVAGPSFAWHASGQVFCDVNQSGFLEIPEDTPLEGVTVRISNAVDLEQDTDTAGFYYIRLPDVGGTYTETLEAGLPIDALILDPSSGINQFTLDNATYTNEQNWLIDSATCQPSGCWLTGGGVKFSSITNTRLAEVSTGKGHGPLHSFGGNVFPSCDPDPGDGGQWNHIAHSIKLHFQGKSIHTVTCGNLDPEVTEPGSESPVTPFNYIEFEGEGTLKGIKGRKVDYGTVYFEARAEDRNEPGNENANKDDGGATIDHYYLRVYDGDGNTLMVVEDASLPGDMDPIRITGGNLQLHISSCDNPPQ